MLLLSVTLSLCQLGPAILGVHAHDHLPYIHGRQTSTQSNVSTSTAATDLLYKGIQAVGGEAALGKLKTVSYHAQ